jgi:hypothetical protein
MGEQESLSWAVDACVGELDSHVAPRALLEKLFCDPHCVAFGPVHHFIVGASLLTALASARGASEEELVAQLAELGVRSSSVPGAACARWGICGAAISTGMAYAIVAGNEPLKKEGWSEGQEMVSAIATTIARSGAPRCCKRDSRIAVDEAARVFEHDFGVTFPKAEHLPDECAYSERNSVCLGQDCPFYGIR